MLSTRRRGSRSPSHRRTSRAGSRALAQDPDNAQFAGQVLTARQLADPYGVTDVDGSRPDAWGYIAAYGMAEQPGKDVERFR